MKPYLRLRFRESPQTGQTCVEREASRGKVSLTSMKTISIVESVCTGAPVCHGKEETAHYVQLCMVINFKTEFQDRGGK